MSEWQPIETAPLDEDQYILVATNNEFKPCDIVRMGWEEGGKPVWFNDDARVDATHWMPLPPPPSPDTTEQKGE